MAYGKPLAGVCASTALFVCGAGGFPVAPSSLPPSTGALALSGSTTSTSALTAGSTIRISGGGFARDAAVTVTVYSAPTPLGTAVADASGHLSTSVTLPTALVGHHTVTALGLAPDGSPNAIEARVDIVSASSSGAGAPPRSEPAAHPVAQLPFTGLNVAGMLAGGLGLVVAGFALIRTAVYRRRFLPAS